MSFTRLGATMPDPIQTALLSPEHTSSRRDGWMDDALCAETDPEAFFPEKGASSKTAKSICAMCDVKERCLQYALDNGFDWDGIYGGLSARERRRLRGNSETRGAETRRRVIQMTARHMTTADIARELDLTPRQVMRHRAGKSS